jgi:hypothetical protein
VPPEPPAPPPPEPAVEVVPVVVLGVVADSSPLHAQNPRKKTAPPANQAPARMHDLPPTTSINVPMGRSNVHGTEPGTQA